MKQLDTAAMHPAEQIVAIISRIYRGRLTTTSGGNISILDDRGDMWITPSQVDKGSLTTDDIMRVRADGTITGRHKPSSEYPFHRAIYRIRPGMRAVLHAHPPALVAFSIVHAIPDTGITPSLRAMCGVPGWAAYGVPGSDDLGEKIAGGFRDNPAALAVVMENHGAVVCGADVGEAFARFEALEMCARAIVDARILGGERVLTDERPVPREQEVPRKREVLPQSTRPDDREARAEIVKMVRRACDQGLMTSFCGEMSVRLGDGDFLITPPGALRWNLAPEDIVRMRNDGGGAATLHGEIYRANPAVEAIIETQPPALTAFAVSGRRFDVRTIPESWIMLKDVPTIPFGTPDAQIAQALRLTPCVLRQNDSVVVTGTGLLHAFDRLEVAEFTARSLIMAESLGGGYKPMPQEEIERLRVAWNVE